VSPPVFFSADDAAVGETLVIGGDEGRHAATVKRLRVGEPVDVTAGLGVRLVGEVVEVRRGAISVEVRDRIEVARPQPTLTVVQALARGGRDEQAVEAMTEVGVDHVVGWEAQRSVARWTDRTLVKWTTTAHAAAKQSRRVWWPQVSGPASTADVAARCQSADLAVVLHESATEPLSAVAVPPTAEIVVVIGPEGGITDEEISVLVGAGGCVVRLGDTVLRSSTAGVAALSVICSKSRWR
jgi:16S rRNA (uracil1498-N3)-methyltransferase